jgi:trehalose 6-phosphate phosphatase
MSDRLAVPLDPLRADPSRSVVLTDFDGTLAPIVTDPAAARPVDGAVDVLGELAGRYRTVAVVSGRPAAFLATVLPPAVEVVGLYGLERVADGALVDHPDAVRWRPIVAAAAAAAVAELPDTVLVEPKGLSLTLHFRTAPAHERDVQRWAARREETDGLVVRPAKMSLELHPPIAVDKGTVVHELADGAAGVCFLGDDVGDLPAFAAVAGLRKAGVRTASIAVRTGEAPAEVLAAGDVVVEGPAGALEVLRALLP